MREDRELLFNHGTRLNTLPPSAIVSTAAADLARRERNSLRGAGEGFEVYAFHRKHVRKAKSAADLLKRALADPGPGTTSGKFNTRLLYEDVYLMQAAAELAAASEISA